MKRMSPVTHGRGLKQESDVLLHELVGHRVDVATGGDATTMKPEITNEPCPWSGAVANALLALPIPAVVFALAFWAIVNLYVGGF